MSSGTLFDPGGGGVFATSPQAARLKKLFWTLNAAASSGFTTPTYVATNRIFTDTSGVNNLSIPGEATAGDLAVVSGIHRNSTTSAIADDGTGDWSEELSIGIDSDGTLSSPTAVGGEHLHVWTKELVGDETTINLTFNLDTGTSEALYMVTVFRGAKAMVVEATSSPTSPAVGVYDNSLAYVITGDVYGPDSASVACDAALTVIEDGIQSPQGVDAAHGYVETTVDESQTWTGTGTYYNSGATYAYSVVVRLVDPTFSPLEVVGADYNGYWLGAQYVTYPSAMKDDDIVLYFSSTDGETETGMTDKTVWVELYDLEMGSSANTARAWWRPGAASDSGTQIASHKDNMSNVLLVLRGIGQPYTYETSTYATTLDSPTATVTGGDFDVADRVLSVIHGHTSSNAIENVSGPTTLRHGSDYWVGYETENDFTAIAVGYADESGTEPAHTWTKPDGFANNLLTLIVCYAAIDYSATVDLSWLESRAVVQTSASIDVAAFETRVVHVPTTNQKTAATEIRVLV